MASVNGSFAEVRARLDEIVTEVRKKDLSLERSLDLYEEAIKLANRCAELVDKADFTEAEARAALDDANAAMEEIAEGMDEESEEPEETEQPEEPEEAAAGDAPEADEESAGKDGSEEQLSE